LLPRRCPRRTSPECDPEAVYTLTTAGRLEKIIKAAVERGASDLHIKAGDVFRARINGKLVPLTKQRLTPDQTKSIALKLMSSEEDRARIERIRDFDCSWGMPGVGRFRVNVLRQRSSFMIVMRVIPFAVPTIESLGLPEVLKQVAESDRGLVLVSGVSGSGKSSTVAAMVHHINRTLHKHVVTIENPIEFLHRDLSCSITQREVGVDTDSLAVGLRAALRQDPDVVVLGDIGDPATIDTSLKAAETGRLVIGTIATPDVVSTVERVIGTVPPPERDVGRIRFSESVRAIVSQQLLPKVDNDGRIAAMEILIATPGARECLKDPERLSQIKRVMAEGRKDLGTQTFDQHLEELIESGQITTEIQRAALATAGNAFAGPRRAKRAASS
jgi:twitching motility protein PilT